VVACKGLVLLLSLIQSYSSPALFETKEKGKKKNMYYNHLCTPALPLHISFFSFLVWAYEVKKI
jgi:hypothetical protein